MLIFSLTSDGQQTADEKESNTSGHLSTLSSGHENSTITHSSIGVGKCFRE